MKVKELIEKLQKFDPELLIMVQGYEGGVDYPNEPYECLVQLNVNTEHWYYGDHETCHATDNEKPDCAAVIIPR
jgi:hypothetical protein